MLYTVGEMAKKLGVAASTLRYYDKEGLLPFVERSNGGIRMFSEKDFEWLSLIECMKRTGMPIKEIKVFIQWCLAGDSTIDQRLEQMKKQRTVIEAKMAELQSTLDALNYKVWYYETAQAAGTCKVPDEMPPEQIPEEFRRARHNLQKGELYTVNPQRIIENIHRLG